VLLVLGQGSEEWEINDVTVVGSHAMMIVIGEHIGDTHGCEFSGHVVA
jgi:hypothetical protein